MNLTYFSSKTEKRVSTIEGRGLFAQNPIFKAKIAVVGRTSPHAWERTILLLGGFQELLNASLSDYHPPIPLI